MSQLQLLVNGVLNGTVSPTDRGLAYGDGVFRTLKVVNGVPQFWAQHYQKLQADCSAIGIVCPAEDLLRKDLESLFHGLSGGACKMMVTRGEGTRGYAPPAIAAPTRIVARADLPNYASAFYESGIVLTVCETHLATQPKLAGIKHLNRLENVLARMEWQDTEIFDGILCDAHNNAIECTAANIFARFQNALWTPDLSQCGVAGVMRELILHIAHELGYETKITPIPLQKLLQADEIIICNSLYGAFQVRQIGTQTFKTDGLGANIRAALGACL